MKNNVVSRAYGRVNLIGEHTDYNGGWVLPTSIPQYTEIKISSGEGQTVNLISSQNRTYKFELGSEKHTDTWVDYLQGGTKILAAYLKEKKLSGFTASIQSTIPEGSGVSSSAALEMSFLRGLNEAFDLNIDIVELAKIGQRIENEFVGARVGIMDQMATGLAKSGEALFLDTKTLSYERVPLPMEEMDLMVINSGLAHKLSATDGGYNERRAQCEKACEILGINQLRDISLTELKSKDLPEILMKRARHVVSENERVHAAVRAIKEKNLLALGKLFVESHESMKNDYQVSIPEIDTLVEICLSHKEVYGARLTGGGFGGSIVAIAKKGSSNTLATQIMNQYEAKTKAKATRLV